MTKPADRYVWERPGSRFFWFSMSVPSEYRDRAGKRVIQCSLGTTDRREAVILAGKKRAELFGQWRETTKAQAPVSVPALVVEQHETLLTRLEEARRARPNDDASQDAVIAERSADLRRFTRRLADGDDAAFRAMADRMIAARSLPIDRNTAEYDALVAGLAEGTIEALSLHQRQHAGEVNPEPRSDLIRNERKRQTDTAAPGETILELFDRYGAVRVTAGKKRADSVEQDRIVVEAFSGFVGASRRLASITRGEVRDWRDTLTAMPTNARNSAAYKNLDMRAAATKAAKLDVPRLSPKTVNKNLSALSSFYRWAVSEGIVETNPCDDLALSIAKETNQREPFSAAQLNTILQSPLFVGFRLDGAEHKPGNAHADDWRRWCPLVAMFTGARIGEVAQLRGDDVESLHGRWFIHLRDDARTGQRTKSGKSRMVPVHRTLEALGFIGFVTRQRERAEADGNWQLFPELEANSRGHMGAEPSKWWRRYLGKIKVKSGADGLGAHAFRHTMADELRAAGFLDAQFGPMILGHDRGGVTGKYGRMAQGTAEMLCEMIDGVSFKGVEFEHLI